MRIQPGRSFSSVRQPSRPRTPAGSRRGRGRTRRTEPVLAFSRPRTCFIKRRLARPVGADQAEHLPARHGQVHLVQRSLGAEPPRQFHDLDHPLRGVAVRHCTPSSPEGAHRGVPPTDQVQDFLGVDIHLSGFGQQGVDPLRQDVEALTSGQRRTAVGDVGARAAARDDDAGRLQLAVGRATVFGLMSSCSASVRMGGSSSPAPAFRTRPDTSPAGRFAGRPGRRRSEKGESA